MDLHPLLHKDAILGRLNNFKPTVVCVDLMKSFFGMMDNLDQLHQVTFDTNTKIKMFLKAFNSDTELLDEIKRDPLNAYETNTCNELNNTTITDIWQHHLDVEQHLYLGQADYIEDQLG